MNDTLLIGIFTAIESAHFYSAFLPSVFTIRTFVKDQAGLEAIRRGETLATLAAIIMILTVAKLSKSNLPLIIGLIMIGVMLTVYESSVALTEMQPVHESTWTGFDSTANKLNK